MNAVNTTAATSSTPAPGSFDDMEPTCTPDRMPLATTSRHTSETAAAAQPHRNAAPGLPAPRVPFANSNACNATPAADTTSVSAAANRNATNAEPVRMEHTTSSMGTPDAEM